jgi:hypothetical protein
MLMVDHCKVTPADMKSISKIPNLSQLGLFSTCEDQDSLAALLAELQPLKHPVGQPTSGLVALALSGRTLCSTGQRYALPENIRSLTSLQNLWLDGFTELPEASLAALTRLKTVGLRSMSLSTLPLWLLDLKLDHLILSHIDWLKRIPRSISNSKLSGLKQLTIRKCPNFEALPDTLGHLEELELLDLSDCGKLHTLPATLRSCRALKILTLKGCASLPQPLPDESTSAHKKISLVLPGLARYRAVVKLAHDQGAMLTTLERMSWLMVLLATVTFVAFIQPPGDFTDQDHQVLVGNFTYCVWNAPKRDSVSANDTGMTEYLERLDERHCALFTFFVLDTLSFSLSLGCVLVIIGISMPRLHRDDQRYEAGRFWLVLVFTWLLMFLAVASGFAAFVASAFAMYSKTRQVLLVPVVVGGFLCFLGFIIMITRFATIFPGWDAIGLALSQWTCCCWSCGLTRIPKWSSLKGGKRCWAVCSCKWMSFDPPQYIPPDDQEDVRQILQGEEFWSRVQGAFSQGGVGVGPGLGILESIDIEHGHSSPLDRPAHGGEPGTGGLDEPVGMLGKAGGWVIGRVQAFADKIKNA